MTPRQRGDVNSGPGSSRRETAGAIVAGTVLLAAVILVSLGIKSNTEPPSWTRPDFRSPEAKSADSGRTEGDRAYSRADFPAAEAAYLKVLHDFSGSEDPDTQDQVGIARLRLGYVAGKSEDFAKAQAWFDEAATGYKGRGGVDPAFGSIDDQGAYQAAVSLAAQGKIAEAEQAFVAFIKERNLSPLVHAAFNRLVRLTGGKPKAEHEALLQEAVTAQEKHIAIESAMCGPKAICHLLKLLGREEPDYHDVAKLCSTTEKGTTILGLRTGLKELGLQSFGYRVNRSDVSRIPLPAISLIEGHYVVIVWISRTNIGFYDPLYRSEREISLPPITDNRFSLDIVTLKLLQEDLQ